MDKELQQKLEEQSVKIDAIYTSVEKTRKYFLTILWVTALSILIPLFGLLAIGPSFLNSYTSVINATQ